MSKWVGDDKMIKRFCFNGLKLKLIVIFFSEIGKVRNNLFQINGYVKEPLSLPDPVGAPIIHTEKVYVPVKEHPEVSVLLSQQLCFEL